MINKYEKEIINKLLDKYEKSKSFIGENKVNQKFSVKVSALFPKYIDHSNYDVFNEINEAIDVLVRKKMVISKQNASHIYNNVVLNLDNLDAEYDYIGRKSKRNINEGIINILEQYKTKNEILTSYCNEQFKRINDNKSVEYFNGNLEEIENILVACSCLLNVKIETFQRDFSVRIFKDSKIFEKIKSKVINLLFQYGYFPEKESVLGNLNIVKNPTYINFKGAGSITIANQMIDLSNINGDIAVSSLAIEDIESIKVTGSSVITIENLTSFHTFNDNNMLIIYLGGYHNIIRREFIKKLYKQNPHVEYYHFGDIDAGGFYILEHLKRETGVEFIPYMMDVKTLKEHIKYSKSLTENDRVRLSNLLDSQYKEVITYMLNNDCKLEQESIDSFS